MIRTPSKQQKNIRIVKMAGLTLIYAMIYHEILARSDAELEPLGSIHAKHPVKTALETSWNYILKKNYEPIFAVAKTLLQNFPSSHSIEDGFVVLINEAEKIAASRTLLRHDLMERIYHTSIPDIAKLLARLALDAENISWNIDWAIPQSLENFRAGRK
ncbi:MAG: hypothetical protein ACTSVM_06865 [Candidatus Ranarchaeia archaeon]